MEPNYELRKTMRAASAPWHGGVEFLYVENMGGGQRAYGEQITMRTVDAASVGAAINPSFVLSNEAAQLLMDDLWNAGLRPSEGSGSAGALAATQKHLDDMRRYSDKLLAKVLEATP